jgi:hypothetical protein
MGGTCRLYSRREFLKTTATGLAMLGPAGRTLGANDEVRVAVLGLGGKGGQHAGVFSKLPGARLAALCDVDPKRLAEHGKRFAEVFSATDPRKILERKDVDAVVIATPDHWHALLAIWACQAGKDVYVEKPPHTYAKATWEDVLQAGDAFTRARQTVARLKQHLLANEVDLQKTPLSLGPWLTVDPGTEQVIGVTASGRTTDIKAAEGLARGSYRAPFVVPERV